MSASFCRSTILATVRNLLIGGVLMLVGTTSASAAAPQDSVTVTFEVVVPEDTPEEDSVFWSSSLNSWDPGADATGFGAQDESMPLEQIADHTWQIDVSAPAGEEVQYNYTRGTIFRVEGAPDYTHPELRTAEFDAPKTIRDTVAVWRDQPPPELADQWPRVDLTPAEVKLVSGETPVSQRGTFLQPLDAMQPFLDLPPEATAIRALPEGVSDPVIYPQRMARSGTGIPDYLLIIADQRDKEQWDVYIDLERDRQFTEDHRVFTLESDTSEAEWTGTVPLTENEVALAQRDSVEITLRRIVEVPEQIKQQVGEDMPTFTIQTPYNHRVGAINSDTLAVSAPWGARFSNFFYVTIDRDGDGTTDIGSGSNEVAMLDRQSMFSQQRYFMTPTFKLGDAWWQVADLDPTGTELMLRPAEPETEQMAIREGGPAPDWEATTLDGTPMSGDALEGQYVLLDFWGSWCAPCITALPKLADAYDQFGGEQFEIVGFAYEPKSSLRQTMEEYDITWPQVLDEDGSYGDQFAVRGYPTYYLVGPDGTIVATGSDLRGDSLVETLESFLE